MKKCILLLFASSIIVSSLILSSCNKEPYKPDYSSIAGYVIAKEKCNINEKQDYWLIDFTYDPNPPKVGDTLVLNGVAYNNVLKTKDLAQGLKQIGMRVDIDYKTISESKIITTGCTVTNPVTYSLKEIFIINQGEIR